MCVSELCLRLVHIHGRECVHSLYFNLVYAFISYSDSGHEFIFNVVSSIIFKFVYALISYSDSGHVLNLESY